MKLSVVIVNYNVRHFLEQCLLSVQRALAGLEAEVFVVDNASSDQSVHMVREKFPHVRLMANAENTGFSRANNQAMKLAKGEYILLLNPDTVVAEDTFEKCIRFMDEHPEAGGMGVRMVDGRGVFLPESKRGLPTPSVAFYKTFGLAALFPKSPVFGKYHLGYLDEHQVHEVEVLSGAFMLMRKSVLDEIGLLDETFFMYGEDVDLSYRIVKAGYKNYYYPETTVIHYKGESTKKGSLNYVRVFYNAMIIFARKHFRGNQSGLFSLLINFAIVFRGALTLLAGLVASSYLFLLDAVMGFAGIVCIKTYWENMIKYSEHYYPYQFLFVVVPVYLLIWIVASFLSGAYDKPFRLAAVLRGVLLGTVAIAVLYAFIPNEWRFSRAMILLGAAWMTFAMMLWRTIYKAIRHQSFFDDHQQENRFLVVGRPDEAQRARDVLHELHYNGDVVRVDRPGQLHRQMIIHRPDEVVFCAADMPYRDIIAQLSAAHGKCSYKILNPGSDALIGSNSKDSAGDLYVAEKQYNLFRPENVRKKRVLEFSLCLLLLPLLPLLILKSSPFAENWWVVFSGRKSWVGFTAPGLTGRFRRAGAAVFSPARALPGNWNAEELETIELNYARYYRVSDDIRVLNKLFSR